MKEKIIHHKIIIIGLIFLISVAGVAQGINGNLVNIKNDLENRQEHINDCPYIGNNEKGKALSDLYFNGDWDKTFGGSDDDEGMSVNQTDDGGFILVGSTYSYGVGNKDVWLIKTDTNGNELWNRTFGGVEYDSGESVKQTFDGGFIITGGTRSYCNGGIDVWLIKTDGDGNYLWNKTFGGRHGEYGLSVQQTRDSGYIIVGYTQSYGYGSPNGSTDVWLIKTDTNGNELWNKTFGGTSRDSGYSVQQTTDEGYILVGETNSYGSGNVDVWVIKTDSEGNELWNRTFGEWWWSCGYFGQQTTDGGYIIVGIAWSFETESYDFFLVKTDGDGNELWNKTLGGSDADEGMSVQQTADGGYIMTGNTFPLDGLWSDILVIKTDEDGNIQWEKTFTKNTYDLSYSVKQTSDGGYIIVGTTGILMGDFDVWLIKTADEPELELKTSLFIGRITNFNESEEIITFTVVNVLCFQLRPFKFIHFAASEQIIISKKYFGLLNNKSIMGFFKVVV